MPYPKLNVRQKAIIEMEQKERALEAVSREPDAAPEAAWQPLGPAPIPINATTTYSGRVSAIAVHPTNPLSGSGMRSFTNS